MNESRHTSSRTLRTPTREIVLALTLALTFLAIACAPAMAHHVSAKRVTLADATAAPTELRMLKRGQRVSFDNQCGNSPIGEPYYFGNVQAYTWQGGALGGQRWNRAHDRMYWRARTGRVTFDGVTFVNRTKRAVLVAGWCD